MKNKHTIVKIGTHQRFKEHDIYGELRRKSSGDNTGTIDSLLTDSDHSSKNRTSSSNSSASLNSTKLDPLSETLMPNTCSVTGWLDIKSNKQTLDVIIE